MEKAKPGPDASGKGSQASGEARSAKLSDLGITCDQSSKWQKLAAAAGMPFPGAAGAAGGDSPPRAGF
jgi:hypothetical protein